LFISPSLAYSAITQINSWVQVANLNPPEKGGGVRKYFTEGVSSTVKSSAGSIVHD